MNISETWLGVASSWTAMLLRIGSTRPMPMKAITQANATAHTARGWEKNDPDSDRGVVGGADLRGHGAAFREGTVLILHR